MLKPFQDKAGIGQQTDDVVLVGEMNCPNPGELTGGKVGSGVGIERVSPQGVGIFGRKPINSEQLSTGPKPIEHHSQNVTYRSGRVVRYGAAIDDKIKQSIKSKLTRKIADDDAIAQIRIGLMEQSHGRFAAFDREIIHAQFEEQRDICSHPQPSSRTRR